MNTITTVLIVVAVLVAIGVALLLWKSFQSRFLKNQYDYCTDEQFEHVKLEPNYLLKLHYLLHASHRILSRAGVRYVAVGGTLLSMVRNGALTPWDDDGDLSVFKTDYLQNQQKINRLLTQYHLHLKDPFWLASLEVFQLRFDADHPLLRKYPSQDEPFVDWILFEQMSGEQNHPESGETCYHHSSAGERKVFPHDFIYENELFPLATRTLKAFSEKTAAALGIVDNPVVELTTPHNVLAYLNRCYGTKDEPEMWRSCYLASSHRSMGLFIKPCKLTAQQIEKL